MPYPNRGVVWHSVQSVFTRLFTSLLLTFFVPQDMCICMFSVVSQLTVFPPDGMQIDYEGALSRRLHVFT